MDRDTISIILTGAAILFLGYGLWTRWSLYMAENPVALLLYGGALAGAIAYLGKQLHER